MRKIHPLAAMLAPTLGLALFLLPVTATPAADGGGAADLEGTFWQGDATFQLKLRSPRGGAKESLPVAGVSIYFPSADLVEISSETVGNVSGTWSASKGNKRRLKGTPNPDDVAAEAEALHTLLEDLVRAELGNGATVTVVPRKGSRLSARLNRDETELDAKLRYNFKGRITVRGRSFPFKLLEKARVKATRGSN